MFNSITKLISGHDRHWKQAYEPYIDLVHLMATRLPPNVSSFFLNVTNYAAVTNGFIIGYDKDENTKNFHVVTKDLKSITSAQFQAAHNINMWTLIAIVALVKPQTRDIIFSQGEKLLGIKNNEIIMIESIMNLSEPDMNKIAMIVYPELATAFDYNDYGAAFFKSAAIAPIISVHAGLILKGFK